MSKVSDSIEQAQGFLGDDIEFTRLDQIFELQRLIGPVVAYKILLGIAINSADDKERRLAASKILDAAGEEPEVVAARLRASIFKDMTIQELEAIVNTGITDPEEAVTKLMEVRSA